jgi:hypothetical protein
MVEPGESCDVRQCVAALLHPAASCRKGSVCWFKGGTVKLGECKIGAMHMQGLDMGIEDATQSWVEVPTQGLQPINTPQCSQVCVGRVMCAPRAVLCYAVQQVAMGSAVCVFVWLACLLGALSMPHSSTCALQTCDPATPRANCRSVVFTPWTGAGSVC